MIHVQAIKTKTAQCIVDTTKQWFYYLEIRCIEIVLKIQNKGFSVIDVSLYLQVVFFYLDGSAWKEKGKDFLTEKI